MVKMILANTAGIGSDGMEITIVTDKVELFHDEYYYGYNASYSEVWADEKKPFINDIIADLKKEYGVTEEQFVEGRHIFKDAMRPDIKFVVYAVSGRVKHHVYEGDRIDCLNFCRDNNWQYDYNGGLIWDLEIEESTVCKVVSDEKVDELIEYLQGTCHSLFEGCVACEFSEEDLTLDQFNEIDSRIFSCDNCGWWYERCEEGMNAPDGYTMCESCCNELEEEEDYDEETDED